jgi:hypothetical protein
VQRQHHLRPPATRRNAEHRARRNEISDRCDLRRERLIEIAIGRIGYQAACGRRLIERQQQRFRTPVPHVENAATPSEMDPYPAGRVAVPADGDRQTGDFGFAADRQLHTPFRRDHRFGDLAERPACRIHQRIAELPRKVQRADMVDMGMRKADRVDRPDLREIGFHARLRAFAQIEKDAAAMHLQQEGGRKLAALPADNGQFCQGNTPFGR